MPSVFVALALLLAAAPQAPDPLDGLTPAARKRLDEIKQNMKAVDREYAEKLVACRGMFDATPVPVDAAARGRRDSQLLAVRAGLYHLMDPRSFEYVKLTDSEIQEWRGVGREWAKASDAPARAEMCGTLGHQSLSRIVDIVKGTGDERSTWEKLQAVVVAKHFDEVRQATTCLVILDPRQFPKVAVPADQYPTVVSTIEIVAYAEGVMSLLEQDDWTTMQKNFAVMLQKEKPEALRNTADNCVDIVRQQAEIDRLTAS